VFFGIFLYIYCIFIPQKTKKYKKTKIQKSTNIYRNIFYTTKNKIPKTQQYKQSQKLKKSKSPSKKTKNTEIYENKKKQKIIRNTKNQKIPNNQKSKNIYKNTTFTNK